MFYPKNIISLGTKISKRLKKQLAKGDLGGGDYNAPGGQVLLSSVAALLQLCCSSVALLRVVVTGD